MNGVFSAGFVAARDLLCGFAAVALYTWLMNPPKRILIPASAIGAVGYMLYDLIYSFGRQEILGYFVGTLFVAVCGEIMARIFKAPSTIFVFPGIIPLVPGIGLYHTMLYIVRAEYDSAADAGARALLSAAVMAVAIAITNLIARYVFPRGERMRGISKKREK